MDIISECFQVNPRLKCPKIGNLRREVQETTRKNPDIHLWRIAQHFIAKYDMNVRRADTVYKWAYETRFNIKYAPGCGDYMDDDLAPVYGGIFVCDRIGNFREVRGIRGDALDQVNLRAHRFFMSGE